MSSRSGGLHRETFRLTCRAIRITVHVELLPSCCYSRTIPKAVKSRSGVSAVWRPREQELTTDLGNGTFRSRYLSATSFNGDRRKKRRYRTPPGKRGGAAGAPHHQRQTILEADLQDLTSVAHKPSSFRIRECDGPEAAHSGQVEPSAAFIGSPCSFS